MIATATSGRAWAVWVVGLSAYFLAVFHRSSLAVAGLLALDRYDIGAAQLATFAMLQLVVYAGMQVPVGLLIDRFGPRTVITCGVIVFSLGQAAFAWSDTYGLALGARVLVGLGDAMTFTCVLRLVNAWFDARRIPLVTQLTGAVGQAGGIIATVPMTWALVQLGWTGAYLVASGAGIVIVVALLLVVRDEPEARTVRGRPLSWTAIRAGIRGSWAEPGTRLGFWIHFTTQFSCTTLALLWGYPFFVRGEHLGEDAAGALLTVMTLACIAAGPVLGWFVGRHPWHRSTVSLSIVAAVALTWTAVLAWPGDAPLWLLVVLVIVVGIAGPASLIGFDVARTSNPADRLATANGIVNQAGFVASLILIIAVGLILDWRTPGSSDAYSAEAFRWAFSFQYVLWGLGAFCIWRQRGLARAAILSARS